MNIMIVAMFHRYVVDIHKRKNPHQMEGWKHVETRWFSWDVKPTYVELVIRMIRTSSTDMSKFEKTKSYALGHPGWNSQIHDEARKLPLRCATSMSSSLSLKLIWVARQFFGRVFQNQPSKIPQLWMFCLAIFLVQQAKMGDSPPSGTMTNNQSAVTSPEQSHKRYNRAITPMPDSKPSWVGLSFWTIIYWTVWSLVITIKSQNS